MKYLDEEEKEIVESFSHSEWKSLKKKDQSKYIDAAKENIELMKKVNIHLSLKDYNRIKIKAMQEGIPLQAYISSIIHRYNKGELNFK
ncbi:MAG: antitoxin [Bacteroidia bacterium]|nr:antitoxin [Bacteroidia bacterium]